MFRHIGQHYIKKYPHTLVINTTQNSTTKPNSKSRIFTSTSSRNSKQQKQKSINYSNHVQNTGTGTCTRKRSRNYVFSPQVSLQRYRAKVKEQLYESSLILQECNYSSHLNVNINNNTNIIKNNYPRNSTQTTPRSSTKQSKNITLLISTITTQNSNPNQKQFINKRCYTPTHRVHRQVPVTPLCLHCQNKKNNKNKYRQKQKQKQKSQYFVNVNGVPLQFNKANPSLCFNNNNLQGHQQFAYSNANNNQIFIVDHSDKIVFQNRASLMMNRGVKVKKQMKSNAHEIRPWEMGSQSLQEQII